jgi:hypothetical protein
VSPEVSEIHSRIDSADSMRSVIFLRRPDGFFAYYEALGEADRTPYETYPDFIPWPKMVDISGIFETLEQAQFDARSTVKWMEP